MIFANEAGRLQLVLPDGAVDVATATGGLIPADPHLALQDWSAVVAWAKGYRGSASHQLGELSAPSPAPGQIFAIGLNYAPHAAESGFELPAYPFVFTKTISSLAGPAGRLLIDSETIDWEVEVVVVIGRPAGHVAAADAWDHIAGVTVGQDFSDREIQWRCGPNSQPTLGKSLPGFGPIGPYLVTPDEYQDPDDIALSCTVNGTQVQSGRTSELIFSVPELVQYLSGILPLAPGDIIFSGTPEGVGMGRTPRQYLKPGDVVETTVEKAGTMRHVVQSA